MYINVDLCTIFIASIWRVSKRGNPRDSPQILPDSAQSLTDIHVKYTAVCKSSCQLHVYTHTVWFNYMCVT